MVVDQCMMQSQLSIMENEMLKACDECGTNFKPYHQNTARFCSVLCANRFWNRKEAEKKRREVIEINCRECNVLFKPTRKMKTFCSDKCQEDYRLNLFAQRDNKIKGVIPCEVCGENFTQRAITNKFCSVACRHVGNIRLEKARQRNNPMAHSAYHADYRKRNNLAVRNHRLRNWYGLLPGEYEAMLANQGNKCAICGDEFSEKNHASKPHIDHDHGPNKTVREILCGRCNSGLGMFQDNPNRLRAAIAYLESHQPPKSKYPIGQFGIFLGQGLM